MWEMDYSALITQKLERWLTAAVKLLPNLAVAILIFIVFYLAAKLVRRLVYKLSCRLSHKQAISNLFAGIAYAIIFLIGLFLALEALRLDKAVSSLLAGAGIIGLALGFAFQDLTANFISGIYITFRKPFDTGHEIETNGFTGIVDRIEFRSTTIKTYDGLHVIIPNKDIFQKPIINHSLTTERKVEINITVPYNKENAATPDQIKEKLSEAIHLDKDIAAHRVPEIYFTDIDGVNLKILVTLWINTGELDTYRLARHRLVNSLLDTMKTF